MMMPLKLRLIYYTVININFFLQIIITMLCRDLKDVIILHVVHHILPSVTHDFSFYCQKFEIIHQFASLLFIKYLSCLLSLSTFTQLQQNLLQQTVNNITSTF